MAQAPAASLSEQNLAIVTAMYAAGASGDVETMTSYLADDLILREPGFLPYGGTYRGITEYLDLYGRITQFLDFSQVTVDHLIAGDEHVMVAARIRDLATGKDTELIDLATVRDGKIVELKIYFHDAQSLARATTAGER